MISKYLKLLPILFCIILISVKCNSSDSRSQPDISKITNTAPVIRLEQELYKIPAGETRSGLASLKEKYPELMEFYIRAVMNISDTSASQTYATEVMNEFLHHPQMIKLNDTIQLVFKDFTKYEKELKLLMRNYQYYFPDQPVPELVTFTSQFGPKSFYYPPYLGVGLDLYLGKDYPYYASMGFPDFFIKRFESKYMATDAAFNIVQDLKEEPLKRGAMLIDMMVYYGKLYYIASHLLPERSMKDFFYYSSDDWNWCVDNEKEIWSFFIDGEWLYAKQYINYTKFIEDAPTTMGMPQGAPDRVGRWVGYQIVKKYMEEFPKTTFEELLNMDSGQKIMTDSRYKPYK